MAELSAYMSTLLTVLMLMDMSFINTIKNSGLKIEPCGTPVVISDFSNCLPVNKTNICMTRTIAMIVVNVHAWPVYPVKLRGSQDQKLYADLTALYHSQVLCQSPSPTYAPCNSVLSRMSTWHGNPVDRRAACCET